MIQIRAFGWGVSIFNHTLQYPDKSKISHMINLKFAHTGHLYLNNFIGHAQDKAISLSLILKSQ